MRFGENREWQTEKELMKILFIAPFKGLSLVAQMVKSLPTMQETWVQSLGQEDLLEKEMETHFSILPEKPHGWRSLVGYSPWCCKELDTTE